MARFSASPIQTSNQITIPLPSSSFSPWFRLQIGVEFPTHVDGTVSMVPLPPRVRVPLVRPSHTFASPTFLLHRDACPSLPAPSRLDPHHSNHTSKRIRRTFFPRGVRSRFRGGSESNRRPRGGKRNRYVSERGFDPRTCGLLIHVPWFMGPPRFHCATPMHCDPAGGCAKLCRRGSGEESQGEAQREKRIETRWVQ